MFLSYQLHKVWKTNITFDMTFDLPTWISMGIMYSYRIIYLPSWSFLGKAFLSYQLHKVWETNMSFDLELWPTDLNINRDHLLTKDYLPAKFEASEAKRSRVISCTRCGRPVWPLTLTFDLNITRDHILIKDYLPTKFEVSGAKPSWVINLSVA